VAYLFKAGSGSEVISIAPVRDVGSPVFCDACLARHPLYHWGFRLRLVTHTLAGGTIAPGGGYVAGREKLIAAVAARLMAPGIGMDAGGVSGDTLRILAQGLFLAPQTTGEALKGGRLVAEVMHREGYSVAPVGVCVVVCFSWHL
jgi:hypothetical protein